MRTVIGIEHQSAARLHDLLGHSIDFRYSPFMAVCASLPGRYVLTHLINRLYGGGETPVQR